tara:strand:+ start:658 stop:780 length:123 start_codon:yes stop_codon:yes gene_type:complete
MHAIALDEVPAVHDDVTEEELVAALRGPGVVYVRKDVLSD